MRFILSFFLLGIVFLTTSSNAYAVSISGASWPTSGAATTGTTGLSLITGGTHVGSTDLPPGSTATGYITGANDSALTFRVEGTTVPLQTDNDYWVRYWVRPSRNATTLAADGSSTFVQSVVDSGTKLRSAFYLRNNGVTDGLGIAITEFLPGGATVGTFGSQFSGASATLPFNKWSEVTIHLHKDGKNGEYALYFNRTLVRLYQDIPTIQHTANFTVDASTDTITANAHSMVEGEAVTLTTTGTLPGGLATGTTYYVRNPTTNTFQLSATSGGSIIDITSTGTGTHTYNNGGLTLSALGSQWTMNFSAINGITWQVGGPIDTYTSSTITNTPLLDTFVQSTDWITKVLPATYNNLTYGGDFWQKTAGSLSATATTYCSGGTCPFRSRFVLSGSQSATATLTTNMDIGTLPYNSSGWATIVFPMLYVPSSGSLNIILNDTSGNQIYEVDIDGGYLKQNGANLTSWAAANRYFLALHLSNSGEVTYSLHDLTSDVTSRNFWSGQLASWTPQAIGRVKYVATRGTADMEVEGLAIARWLPLFGVDSLTASNANAVSPVLTIHNHIAAVIGPTHDYFTFPGGMYAFRSQNLPRLFAWGIVGRAGRTRDNFTNNVLPYMNYTRGAVMTFVDGGSINDIATIDSNEAARTTMVNQLTTQATQAITQLTSNQNRVWQTTMINRVQGTTYTTTERNAILDYDTALRTLHQSYPNVYFSDPAADIADHSTLFTAGDDTHFNAAGDITYATYMVTDFTSSNFTPSASNLGPTNLTNGSTIDDTTPTFTFITDDGDEDAVTYQLQIDTHADFSSPVVDHTSSSAGAGVTSYTATSSLSSGSYYWRVRVSDGTVTSNWVTANGGSVAFVISSLAPSNTSNSSAILTNTTPSAPVCEAQVPGAKTPWVYAAIPQTNNSILLYFTEAGDPVDKYVLEYGTKSGNYAYGAPNIGGKGTRTYLVKSLAPNTKYFFRVRGGNGCATGGWSNEIMAKTKPTVVSKKLSINSKKQTKPIKSSTPNKR